MTNGLLFPFSFCAEDIFRCPAQVSKDVLSSARTDLVAQGAISPEEQLGTIVLNLKPLQTGGLWWGHHCGQDITWAVTGEYWTSRVAPTGPCGCVLYSTLGYWWLRIQVGCCTGSNAMNKGMQSSKMLFDGLKNYILQGAIETMFIVAVVWWEWVFQAAGGHNQPLERLSYVCKRLSLQPISVSSFLVWVQL